MFVDTHCHLDDPKLIENVGEIVNEYLSRQVVFAITMGCDVVTSNLCRELAEKFDSIYFGAGLHPIDMEKTELTDLAEIEKLTSHDKCVCIGEVGLDFYWDKTFKQKQIDYFYKIIELSEKVKLPMSIHLRDATCDGLKVLKESKNKLSSGGVIHCYNGSKETLREILNLGLDIGVGGTLTFKNARNVLEIAEYCPLDRIVTETDCPYLSPEPFRGKINSPKNIPVICQKLAEIKNVDLQEVAETIMQNTKRIFKKIDKK